MLTNTEYALLAANVYGNSSRVRFPLNILPIPDGWDALISPPGWTAGADGNGVVSSDGFMATAYQNGNDIVISYAGTTDENLLDWITGNLPAATAAFLAPQILDAAKFYLDVAKANPGANITFTGHSLGGGLASLMAVLFNKQAVVFDEAPFLKSADSSTIVNQLRSQLAGAGYTLPYELSSYETSVDPSGAFLASPSRVARQGNVQQIYTVGEALSLVPTALTDFVAAALGTASTGLGIAAFGVDKIIGPAPISYNPYAQTMLGWGSNVPGVNGAPADLHSISLLNGFMMSSAFLATTQIHPELLARLFGGLYPNNPKSTNANLLDLLVQRQYRGEHALDVLSSDVNKISGAGLTSVTHFNNASGSSEEFNVAAALVDAEFGGLYEQGKDRAPTQPFVQEFSAMISNFSGGLTLDARQLGSQANIAMGGLRRLFGYLSSVPLNAISVNPSDARWTLQTGTAALNYVATDSRSDIVLGYVGDDTVHAGGGDDVVVGYDGADQLFGDVGDDTLVGGIGDDDLLGGTGNDTLYGGDGSDILVGGKNNDQLFGGSGNDQYYFVTGDGSDIIQDTDGQGALYVNSTTPLAVGDRRSKNTWSANGGTVTIERQSVANSNALFNLVVKDEADSIFVTVRNWTPGALGITLSETSYPTGGELLTDIVPLSNYDPTSRTFLASGSGFARSYSVAGGGSGSLIGPQGGEAIHNGVRANGVYIAADISSDVQQRFDGPQSNDLSETFNSLDNLVGGSGDDKLYGLADNDSLEGNDSNDALRKAVDGRLWAVDRSNIHFASHSSLRCAA